MKTIHHLRNRWILSLLGLSVIFLGIHKLDQSLTLSHGLIGKYYANPYWYGNPQYVTLDSEISSELLKDRGEKFQENRFSVEWNGFIVIEKSGKYTFMTASDDGSWLSINNQQIVNNGGTD